MTFTFCGDIKKFLTEMVKYEIALIEDGHNVFLPAMSIKDDLSNRNAKLDINLSRNHMKKITVSDAIVIFVSDDSAIGDKSCIDMLKAVEHHKKIFFTKNITPDMKQMDIKGCIIYEYIANEKPSEQR
ncbi:MAG: hypothetical protein PHC62_00990 [Candidatus Izemoplasmatales bacterium]|nr:hypothetical protein [Candidatus Izemoplasmatales bacterium]